LVVLAAAAAGADQALIPCATLHTATKGEKMERRTAGAGRTFARLLVSAAMAVAAAAAHADLSGEVIRILDGDTLEVLVDQRPVRIRLTEIDAPEKKQAFGNRARQALSELVFRRVVVIREAGQDRYGRTLGTVLVDGRSANREMVRSGMAWAYRAYLIDKTLLDLETQAREARRGLWVDPNPIAPWEWRANVRNLKE
jgi:micrococcal nuclease